MGKLTRKISYFAGLVEKHGPIGLGIKFIEKRSDPIDRAYRRNWRRYLPTAEELDGQRVKEQTFAYRPLISVVVPVYRTPERFFREMVESLLAQSYQNWELCVADGSGNEACGFEKLLRAYADPRLKYRKLEGNGGISRNTNEGLSMALGEYIGLMDHDDLLAENALYEVVRKLNASGEAERAKLIYSDEDKVSSDLASHFEPHFKPDYNEELLNHYNYICHFFVFHRSMLKRAGMMDAAFDGAQDYDFILRCAEQTDKKQIAHIKKVLYHWRVHEASTARFSGHKDYAYEAGKRAVQAHFDRVLESASDAKSAEGARRFWTGTQVLSVRGREYVEADKELHASAANYAVYLGKGIRPLREDWGRKLLQGFAGHKDKVGMVGGRLVSPGGRALGHVVACGYTFDRDGEVFPLFYGLKSYKKGYYRRAAVSQQVSACSLDFCVIDKRAQEEVGGVDTTLPAPYRDMDFAFRLRKAGYQVILDAGVSARAASEAERGHPQENLFAELMKSRWKEYIEEGDPFYNENIRCDGSL